MGDDRVQTNTNSYYYIYDLETKDITNDEYSCVDITNRVGSIDNKGLFNFAIYGDRIIECRINSITSVLKVRQKIQVYEKEVINDAKWYSDRNTMIVSVFEKCLPVEKKKVLEYKNGEEWWYDANLSHPLNKLKWSIITNGNDKELHLKWDNGRTNRTVLACKIEFNEDGYTLNNPEFNIIFFADGRMTLLKKN